MINPKSCIEYNCFANDGLVIIQFVANTNEGVSTVDKNKMAMPTQNSPDLNKGLSDRLLNLKMAIKLCTANVNAEKRIK